VSSVKTESMYPDCESEIDVTLRPMRRALYSLLVGGGVQGGEGGGGGGGGWGGSQWRSMCVWGTNASK